MCPVPLNWIRHNGNFMLHELGQGTNTEEMVVSVANEKPSYNLTISQAEGRDDIITEMKNEGLIPSGPTHAHTHAHTHIHTPLLYTREEGTVTTVSVG